jgi:deferrochelatase/peroxidase EfeB
MSPDHRLRRRTLLGAGTAAAAGAIVDRALSPTQRAAAADAGTPTDGGLTDRVPFEGRNQPGIATPQPRQALLAAFDVVADDRPSLAEALRALSEHSRGLMGGHRTLIGNPGEGPTPESGILGTRVQPDALTVTVGLGASLFDERYDLAARRPKGLVRMPTFPDDALVESECHGDVLLQLCANTEETLLNALRDLMRATRGALAARWKIEGFRAARRERGASRNLLGFKDGTSNPDVGEVWSPEGGTFQVVRIIRNRVEFWDRVSLDEQELMIGRRKDTGAPLDGRREMDAPNYTADPRGRHIPLDAHIRLANPRTKETESRRILRRGYNYSRGIDDAGQLDMGLAFVSFQRDLEHFADIQRRLAGEPLVDYVVPTGGGYFYCPPGAADSGDWVGSGLLV